MAPPKKNGIDIDENLAHHRLEWKIERIGWVVIAAVLVLALAGLFGPGPLSNATSADATGTLTVRYQRFERYQASSRLEVEVGPRAIRDGELRLWVTREYIRRMHVTRIDPRPASEELDRDRAVYVFRVPGAGSGQTILFHLEPNESGRLAGEIGVAGGPRVRLRQFVYP